MKNIAIIPARGGSKRLPDKNLLLLGGIPLVAHSILYAQKHEIIDSVFVSTDDQRIKATALEYGAKVIDRPDHLSGDLEPTVTALKHCLDHLPNTIENVFLLQPTNPLRPSNLLEEAYAVYKSQQVDSLVTVTRNDRKFGKITNDRFVPFNYEPGQRSQDLEPLYFENGLLYISSSKLINAGAVFSENAYPFVVDHAYADVDIDVQEDFDYAAFLLNL